MGIHTLNASDWKADTVQDGIILDVRTVAEHEEKRLAAPHAHVPLDTLNPEDIMLKHGLDSGAPVYLLCKGGKRATQAAEKFQASGFTNLTVIEGGLIACEAAGHATIGTASGFGKACAIPNKSEACS
ncbi:MAG: rhodanese-like domain-containing protein [Proteobacteria bacterium]|nr:rhodanese-like domain-containing protein [Pseudomonadota bacterium]